MKFTAGYHCYTERIPCSLQRGNFAHQETHLASGIPFTYTALLKMFLATDPEARVRFPALPE
jgi:hypothetical protein